MESYFLFGWRDTYWMLQERDINWPLRVLMLPFAHIFVSGLAWLLKEVQLDIPEPEEETNA